MLCRFGAIADIQYANLPNGQNFMRTRIRYYRNSLNSLREAIQIWNEDRLDFVLQLGDIIDGRNSSSQGKSPSKDALETVLSEFEKSKAPVYHIFGNHELYNFTRKQILESNLNSTLIRNTSTYEPGISACYSFTPVEGVRVIMIDSYDISMLGNEESSEEYRMAEQILTKKNRNEDLNSPEGLFSDDQRFLKFNGGLSVKQMEWLEKLLESADKLKEKVIIGSHIPALVNCSDYMCLLWNYEEVLSMLERHPCVKVFLCGHTHCEAYDCYKGVHHVTLPGVVEIEPGRNGFCSISVYEDRIELDGYGMKSRVMSFRNDCV